MASTIVTDRLPSGLGTLTLKLYPKGSSVIANGAGGDDASEDGTRLGYYEWTVTESITGRHDAFVEDSSGNLIRSGFVNLEDDTNRYPVIEPSGVEDIYHADIDVVVDDTNSQDEYTVVWYKNGIVQTSGITSPTIQVVKRADGTDLVGSTSMTQIGSTGYYKYDESTNRITAGEAIVVKVQASIDGSTRTWTAPRGRDV